MDGDIWEFDEIGVVLNNSDHKSIKVIDSFGNTKKVNKLQIKRRINERS